VLPRKREDLLVEENSRSNLYKIELCLLKILPMLLSLLYLMNTILSYFDLDLIIFSLIGGVSIIPLLFIFISSYVFKFCAYHRMFLYYIVFNDVINLIDWYLHIPISDKQLLIIQLIIAGIFLFIILYLYVHRADKERTSKNFK
jgi:hypothetical protein